MPLQKTLLILKPEVTIRRTPGVKVIERLLEEPFNFLGLKRFTMPLYLVEAHYEEHVGKPFFHWLRDYIRSAPVMPIILEGEDVITRMRDLLGTTMVADAAPNTLRGKYGIWKGINVAHASDSLETSQREIALWKKLAGLDETYDSIPDLEEYVRTWGGVETDYTKDLRWLSQRLEENNDELADISKKMRDLLDRECVDVDQQVVDTFLKSMVDNCLR